MGNVTLGKSLDFSGQNIYVGMDVPHKSWKIHILNDELELKSFSQDPGIERWNYTFLFESHTPGKWVCNSTLFIPLPFTLIISVKPLTNAVQKRLFPK